NRIQSIVLPLVRLGSHISIWLLMVVSVAVSEPITEVKIFGPPKDNNLNRTIVLDREQLSTATELSLDDLLRQQPGFQLFRQTSSLVAHPTTQGPTFAGVPPSGGGRTLTTLNSVPINNP